MFRLHSSNVGVNGLIQAESTLKEIIEVRNRFRPNSKGHTAIIKDQYNVTRGERLDQLLIVLETLYKMNVFCVSSVCRTALPNREEQDPKSESKEEPDRSVSL